MLVYIGTQVAEPGQGVFAAFFDEATGRLAPLASVAAIERPTFVLADQVRSVLYVASEVGNAGDRIAEVASFAMRTDDSLELLSRTPSGGGGATHLALHPGGRRLFVANFGGGQVAVLPVGPDGGLGAACSVQTTYGSGPHRRQSGPHAHGVTLDPSGRFLLAPDMGADRIFVYRYDDATGVLSAAESPFLQLTPGSGPRLLIFGGDSRFAYVLSELSAEIFVLRWDSVQGRLDEVASCALDGEPTPEGRSAAALTISRDGRFLYTSNRRTGTLHVHEIDAASGTLTQVQAVSSGGGRPWHAEISLDGRWMLVANQASNDVRAFAVDSQSGRLSSVGEGIDVPTPTSVAFAP